jgi:hypothetical protein
MLYTMQQQKPSEYYFLTIDFKFIEFLKSSNYPVKGVVITPKELRAVSAFIIICSTHVH